MILFDLYRSLLEKYYDKKIEFILLNIYRAVQQTPLAAHLSLHVYIVYLYTYIYSFNHQGARSANSSLLNRSACPLAFLLLLLLCHILSQPRDTHLLSQQVVQVHLASCTNNTLHFRQAMLSKKPSRLLHYTHTHTHHFSIYVVPPAVWLSLLLLLIRFPLHPERFQTLYTSKFEIYMYIYKTRQSISLKCLGQQFAQTMNHNIK